MNQSFRFSTRNFRSEIFYLAASVVVLVIWLAVQHRVFRRIDYNSIVVIFTISIAWKMRTWSNIKRWFWGIVGAYLFCIAAYLGVLGVNRYIYSHQPISGFIGPFDLFIIVPWYSMAIIYFALQGLLWFTPPLRRKRADVSGFKGVL